MGEDLDSKVQKHLCKVRDGGGLVSAQIAFAAARNVHFNSSTVNLLFAVLAFLLTNSRYLAVYLR